MSEERNVGPRISRSDFLKRGLVGLFVGGAVLTTAAACGGGMNDEDNDDDDEDD